MKKKITPAVILLLLFTIMASLPVMASDISNAKYYGVITVSNNGTATETATANFTLSTADMITQGWLNSSANNCAIRNTSGADAAFMPSANSSYPWCVYVGDMNANEYRSYLLYTANTTGGKIRYFPGAAGITTEDDASLELGGTFYIEISGYFDTTVTDNICRKQGAFRVYSSSGNVSVQFPVETVITNTTQDATRLCLAAGNTRIAQKYSLPECEVQSANVSLSKTGSPTGTGYFRVRKFSDNSILGTLGTIDVSTLTGSQVIYTFDSAKVYVPTGQDVYLSFEYSGGDGANYIDVGNSTSSIIDGVLAEWGGAAWVEPDPAYDLTFSFTYAAMPDESAAAALTYPVANGEHTVKVLGSIGISTALHIDGVEQDTGSGIVVPDNANNIISFENYTMPYVEYQEIKVGANVVQNIQWEYDTTFTDSSGYGNDATPTFRTTGTDADITAAITSFTPLDEAEAPAYSIADQTLIITNAPTVSGNFTTSVNATMPGADIFREAATEGETPVQILFIILASLFVIIASLGFSYATRKLGGHTIMGKVIWIICLFGIMIATRIFDLWMLLFLIIIALAIMTASKEGIFQPIGTSWIGGLVFMFLGMTLINRVLEGQLLTTDDFGYLQVISFTDSIEVFGMFTVPTINFEFFTVGLPKLVQFDYSFFGGNAGLIQYALFSFTAAISFVLFTIIIGIIFQVFNK